MATLPSLQTTIEQYETAVRQERLEEIPGVPAAMAEHEAALETINQSRYDKSEKQRLRDEAASAYRSKVAELKTSARAAFLRGVDQQQGQLLAAARTFGVDATDARIRAQAFANERARQLTDRADRAATVRAALDVHREALLTADDHIVQIVGATVQAKLDALGESEKGKATTPIRDSAELFKQEFASWQRAHPSPTQQLDQIERARGQAEVLFEESANFALRLYGIGSAPTMPTLKAMPEVGTPRSGLVFGSYWDRISGRK